MALLDHYRPPASVALESAKIWKKVQFKEASLFAPAFGTAPLKKVKGQKVLIFSILSPLYAPLSKAISDWGPELPKCR